MKVYTRLVIFMTHLLLPRVRISEIHFMVCLTGFGLLASHIHIDNTSISLSYFSKANFDFISIRARRISLQSAIKNGSNSFNVMSESMNQIDIRSSCQIPVKKRSYIYRPIFIFNRNPLSVQTNFSHILDCLSKLNRRQKDRTHSLLTDGRFEGSEKWL